MDSNYQQDFENYSPFQDKNLQESFEMHENMIGEEDAHEHEQPESIETPAINNFTEYFLEEAIKEGIGYYEKPEQEDFFKGIIDKTLSFAKQKLIRDSSTFLSPEKNIKATSKNQVLASKSGIKISDIFLVLDKHFNTTLLRLSLLNHNNNNPSNPYPLNSSFGKATADSLFTEAIHQFQIDHFLNTGEHDGIMGSSTLETMGFTSHGLKTKLNSSGFYGQKQLNRGDVNPQVPLLTNKEFTADNWYQFIVKPAWLGVKITQGIHLVLLRKLRAVETWLLSQPQYKGFTPAALGKALGLNANSQYSGARLSPSKSSMHGFGLAIDINVPGNPWVGAGWIKNDPKLLKERTRFIEDLRKASGIPGLKGNTIFAYLHSIAESSGSDTKACYDTLQQRNKEFKDYLGKNPSVLSYWRSSATFGNRNPLNGFLNLHSDLVYALRQVAGLAWGAIDFGPRASGDIMHFDLRTLGVGKFLCGKIKGFVPEKNHPALDKEVTSNEWETDNEFEHHEAIEENEWEDEIFS